MAIDKRITGEAGELEIEEKDITEVLDPSGTRTKNQTLSK
jgi:hypothetical protein